MGCGKCQWRHPDNFFVSAILSMNYYHNNFNNSQYYIYIYRAFVFSIKVVLSSIFPYARKNVDFAVINQKFINKMLLSFNFYFLLFFIYQFHFGYCSEKEVEYVLIHSYYYEKNDVRRKELETALYINANNTYINKIYLFIEKKQLNIFENYNFIPTKSYKIHLVPVSKQPTYKDLFRYANDIFITTRNMIVIIQNADIMLTESIKYAIYVEMNQVFALSRWQLPCEESIYPEGQCKKYQGSHDTFIFKTFIPEKIMEQLEFPQNRWNAENAVIYELKKGGFNVINPCYTIKLTHNHCSNIKHTPQYRAEFKDRFGIANPMSIITKF